MKKKFHNALKLIQENAVGLLDEADLLYENRKFGRAYSLYHLSFEECGRYFILFNYLAKFHTGQIKAKDLNYGELKKLGFEKHGLKIQQSIDGMLGAIMLKMHEENDFEPIPDFAERILNQIDEVKVSLGINPERLNYLNELKNIGLYVTFRDNEFHLPDKTIKLKDLLQIQRLARINTNIINGMNEIAKHWGWD